MARPTLGHVIERTWSDGETVSYAAQVRAYGRYEWVTFGTDKEGWNRTRAELETESHRSADRAQNVGAAAT